MRAYSGGHLQDCPKCGQPFPPNTSTEWSVSCHTCDGQCLPQHSDPENGSSELSFSTSQNEMPDAELECASTDRLEDRVRAALGLASGRLPRVDEANLLVYHTHLAAHLLFPFEARRQHTIGHFEEIMQDVTVVKLCDPTTRSDGARPVLLCCAFCEGVSLELPLDELEVSEGDDNHRLIEDFWYWSWNYAQPAGREEEQSRCVRI